MTEPLPPSDQASRQLADQLNQAAAANEANVLLLAAAVNILFRLAVKSNIVEAQAIKEELDRMADSIMTFPRLASNESAKRRMPLLKKMLLDGTQDMGVASDE